MPFSTSALEYITPEILFSSPRRPPCSGRSSCPEPSTSSRSSSLLALGRPFLNPQEPLDGGGELFYLLVGLLAVFYGLPTQCST